MSWFTMMGIILVLYAGFVIYKGRISVMDENNVRTSSLTRSEKPVQFWFLVVMMLVIAGLLLFNVFHF